MRKLVIILLAVILIFNMGSCTERVSQYKQEFFGTFDTIVTVIGYTGSQSEFENIVNLVHDDFVYLNTLFDIYNDYDGINNIKTINDSAGTAVKVDEPIIELILTATQWYEKTGGAVNIALGPVLYIWHDYRTSGIENPDEAKLPPTEELTEASMHCDMSKVVINEENSTVFIEKGMRLDVGAIAKGYATQHAAELIKEKGYDHVLISAGGNVTAIGTPDDSRTKWSVGIKDPDSTLIYSLSEENLLDVAYVKDLSVVTSGSYERFYTVDGKNYHHIIDRETLMPSVYYKSVTVIAVDSTEADALSTALFIMEPIEALAFVERTDGVEALWVLANGEMILSGGMSNYLRDLGGATNN